MKCYVLFLLYFLVHLVVFIFVGVCSSNVDLCFLYHYQEMNFQKLSLGVCKWYNSSSVIIPMATQQCLSPSQLCWLVCHVNMNQTFGCNSGKQG